jgi:hypothetical protein
MRLFPAAASHQFFLADLSLLHPEIWADAGQARLRTIKRGPTRPACIWDLHRIADVVGELPSDAAEGNKWFPLRPREFTDDAGSEIWQHLGTPFAVHPLTYPKAEKSLYKGSFGLSPLIFDPLSFGPPADDETETSPEKPVPDMRPGLKTTTEDDDTKENQGDGLGLAADSALRSGETFSSEVALIRAMLYPLLPFALASTIPNHRHYGPLFFESISISASGQGELSPVEIRATFEGGKSLVSPTMLPVDIATYDEGGDGPPAAYRYRTANFGDCRAGFETYATVEELYAGVVEDRDAPKYQMVEMTLGMRQNVNFSFPSTSRNDIQGPRYASIVTDHGEGQTLSGSLIYFSRSDTPLYTTNKPLTLYFGGPFFFQFANVDWQEPELSVVAGKGWFHTYNFIVRTGPHATLGGVRDLPLLRSNTYGWTRL